MTELPSRLLRQDVVYRTGGPRRRGVRAVGFMLKPARAHAYRDRVLDCYVAVYVLRGSGTFVDWRGRAQRVSGGCVVQLTPGRKHSVVQDADGQWAEAYLDLDGTFARELIRVGAIDESRLVLRPGVDLALAERFDGLLRGMRDGPDEAMPQWLASAHELIVALHTSDRRRRDPEPHALVVDAACALLAQPTAARDTLDVELTLLLERHALSYERFRKIFRRRTGLGPGEYRIRRRIDRARTLIAQDRMSNKQVAYALGYRDPFTFSKQFKQVVGVSPEGFRKLV